MIRPHLKFLITHLYPLSKDNFIYETFMFSKEIRLRRGLIENIALNFCYPAVFLVTLIG
jgi:hypothetical protein